MLVGLSAVILLSLVTSAIGILTGTEGDKIGDSFEEWRERFGRNYTTRLDEEKARKNLARNLWEIHAHNARFRAGLETYSRGLWEHSDLSYEEKLQLLAGSHVNSSRVILQGQRRSLKQGPPSVNWVKQGRVHPVVNQRKCGSCFAIAAVGAAEGVLLKNGDNTRLSFQQIVDCDKLNGGCDGGDPLLAFRYMKMNGIASADQYPYTGRQGRCKQTGNSKLSNSSASRELLDGNEKRLKDIVATYGPVAVAINAAQSLTNYKSGVYTNPKCSKAMNHAVLVVGYGNDPKSKLDYWLVKNSWGTTWGEAGYVRMARNKGSICGIAGEVYFAT